MLFCGGPFLIILCWGGFKTYWDLFIYRGCYVNNPLPGVTCDPPLPVLLLEVSPRARGYTGIQSYTMDITLLRDPASSVTLVTYVMYPRVQNGNIASVCYSNDRSRRHASNTCYVPKGPNGNIASLCWSNDRSSRHAGNTCYVPKRPNGKIETLCWMNDRINRNVGTWCYAQ